ncbi:MAG TPA: tRNA uridine-5-carboxymethylaminomethyl(34) synthesis GTPase MnmE [Candidatus Competibacteraceae bacterium]|nr:tRNA uridine-5-carboxymethylaminomethyl(34) synthesis GTPase MnmE [Candidatus Competibacteraceae bacterium]
MNTDTIAAIATPPGRGGVGIVRVSGPAVPAITTALLGALPQPRYASFRRFRDAQGRAIDEGLALYFPAPHSYTGESVLELHGHGGPVVMDLLLERVLELGARLARPGEFTERAFLNDRLDLAQAEAVADLIDAGTREAARAALGSLEGAFSQRVQALVEGLIELRVYVEAAIDFPEEELDFLADGQIQARLDALRGALAELLASAHQGRLLRDGMTVVIAGRPNAGKSSLLNALAGFDAAIVTDIPGTTRDVLRERISIDGMPLHVVDTAGLREAADVVEREGIRRAWAEIERADRVLVVIDQSTAEPAAEAELLARLPPGLGVTRVYNKIDLSGHAPALEEPDGAHAAVYLSAQSGAGLDLLRRHLKRCMGYQSSGTGLFSARRRHLDALRRAGECLERAAGQLAVRAGELVAEELRLAQQALGEITGELTSDELLGRIFSSFCIGK